MSAAIAGAPWPLGSMRRPIRKQLAGRDIVERSAHVASVPANSATLRARPGAGLLLENPRSTAAHGGDREPPPPATDSALPQDCRPHQCSSAASHSTSAGLGALGFNCGARSPQIERLLAPPEQKFLLGHGEREGQSSERNLFSRPPEFGRPSARGDPVESQYSGCHGEPANRARGRRPGW